jgi:hypothetical protein
MKFCNLFINSFNKNGNSETNYNYNLNIPEFNLQCKEDEQLSLCITNFNTNNVFYNINEKNNTFQFKTIKNGITTISTLTIPIGNYDVYSLALAMDQLIVAEGNIAYVPLINKFSFIKKNSSNSTQVFFNINSDLYKILNVPYNTDIQMLPNVINYSGLLNLTRFNYILIYINGISCYNQNISNITTNKFKTTNLVAIINRSDVLPYGTINYVEIAKNNEILIGNKQLNAFNIIITNEYGELLTDLDNWTMTIKFYINKNI